MPDGLDVIRLRDSTGQTECVAVRQVACPDGGPVTQAALGVGIPGYEILGELGRGGMGVVYKARQLSLNRIVALKVLIGGAHAGSVEKARFRLEAEAVARLHHPNIVQVYDVGEWSGTEYIAFEFVDGPTVRKWQNGIPVEPDVAARIGVAVARAVQHAHDRGIVHRDLKPANVLLAGGGERGSSVVSGEALTVPDSRCPVRVPKVMDFGLAKAIDGGTDLTVSGVACGTPNYMAPEQVRGGPAASRRTVDVWGVGAVLFETLTGQLPFLGTDAASIMRAILVSDPPSVRKFVPAIPRDLAVIVAKCLEKDPARRYLTPADVADDLDRFLNGRPILARPAGAILRMGRWVSRNPMAATLGTFLLLGLCGVSAFAVALQQSAERERAATERERLALAEEARLRKEAEEATRAAENARDEVRQALRKAEEALGEARDAQHRVENEKNRAEQNLLLARKAVTNVLGTIAAHNEDEHPARVPVFRQLLGEFEPFVAQMIAQKSHDRDLRFDRAMIVLGRGIMDSTSGRTQASREHLLQAAELFRALVKDDPQNAQYRRELGHVLATAGCVSTELRSPDAAALVREAQQTLEVLLTNNPTDVPGLQLMIDVRLVLPDALGDDSAEEHNRAVLVLVDRLAKLVEPTPRLSMIRAHALNNIASDLTNRGKTDEAETFWLEVLAIREELARTASDNKILRYELAKCLTNYANQLLHTDRLNQAFQHRERAAAVFDTLREDARFRATYVPLMVDTDVLLAAEYVRRMDPGKALDRLNKAIALNAVLLARDPSVARVRGSQADAHTRRAELHEGSGQHASAARDYKFASELSTQQPHREYCSTRHVQSLARAGELSGAVVAATKLNPDTFCHPLPCLELARAWVLIAKLTREDVGLSPQEQDQAVETALRSARVAILTAQKKGFYRSPQEIRAFHAEKNLEPIWDVFPRQPE